MSRRISPQQNIILTLFVALTAIGVFVWAYVSMAIAVGSADASFREIGGKIAALEEDRKQVRILGKMMEERKTDFIRIDAFFVSRDRPIDFIEQVEDLAKRTQNTVVLDVDEARGDSSELGFRLTVDGSEGGVSRYLRTFELLPYAVRVEDMVFQRLSGGEGDLPPGAGTATARLILVIKVKAR